LLGLSYWGYSRGRFQKYWYSALILSASLNLLLIAESNIIFPITLMVISALQFYDFTVNDRGGKNLVDRNLYTIFLLLPTFLLTIQIPETIMINDIDVLPILVLIAFYSLSYLYRESKENLVMTPEFFFAMLLLPIFIIVNVNDYNENIQKTISLILLVVILSVILLINESGGVRRTTPLERLFGIIYLLPVAVISSDILLEVDASITYLILHDILILSAP
jgi:CDP-diglyceride synthetase